MLRRKGGDAVRSVQEKNQYLTNQEKDGSKAKYTVGLPSYQKQSSL